MKTTTQPSAAGSAQIKRVIMACGVTDPKVRRIIVLMEAGESAAQWLCDCPVGTDQKERGDALRAALDDFEGYAIANGATGEVKGGAS